ncbi:MAG: enoyl-CoA hydratase-related protein [Pseudomonadales bacterium]
MSRADSGTELAIDDADRVRLLTVQREDALNAYDDRLYDAVRKALDDAARRDDIACVVLTGRGRSFCAGTDLGELAQPVRHDDGRPHGFEPFIATVEAFPKPLLAAVNGIAVGIGVTILPHCDLVLMSQQARLRAPFVTLGVTTEAGSSALLAPLIGWQRAAELLYTARWIDAATAVDWGLASRLCAPDQLLPETLALAREIAAMPVASLVATKKLLLGARLDAVRAARAREREEFAALLGGPANREALAAFRERREPDFRGL